MKKQTKKQRKINQQRAGANDHRFGVREYTRVLAEGLHTFKTGCRMLAKVNLMLTAVKAGLEKSPNLFEADDHKEFTQITADMLATVETASVELESIQFKHLTSKEAMDAGKDGDMLPVFVRDESINVHDWANTLNQEVYAALSWTQSSTEVMNIIATVAKALAEEAANNADVVNTDEETKQAEVVTKDDQ